MDDAYPSLLDVLARLDRREISAVELLEGQLDRIAELDGPINAVVTVDPEAARAAAAAADEQRARGSETAPIAGVSITIKDAIEVAGLLSTGGARELTDHVPDTDAVAVARLRAAGAGVFAKTNVPAWSGDVQTYNELFGTTNNPWNLDHTPGGSSGGAAAAVAMGYTPFEVGTDIGGSVRIPASHCGVYGHKPSYGLISTHGYLDWPGPSIVDADVNVFGPFARTVDDLEFVFDQLIGPHATEAPAWSLDLPPARASKLGDFRIAAWVDDPFCPVSPAVDRVLQGLLDRIESGGGRVDRHARPALAADRAARIGLRLISAATDISFSDSEWQAKVDSGAALSYRAWDMLRRERAQIRQNWAEFFADFDVLLCPVSPVEPIRHTQAEEGSNFLHSTLVDHDDRPYPDLVGWTSLIGSAYLPATVPPVGLTAAGLPVGVQVVAPYLHDRTALAFCRALAEEVGVAFTPPAARPSST